MSIIIEAQINQVQVQKLKKIDRKKILKKLNHLQRVKEVIQLMNLNHQNLEKNLKKHQPMKKTRKKQVQFLEKM